MGSLATTISILTLVALLGTGAWAGPVGAIAQLRFDIVGTTLVVRPDKLTVPRGIATSVNTAFEPTLGSGASDTTGPFAGALVEAELRGPLIQPTRLVTTVGRPLALPAFPVAGQYFLDRIRLVKGDKAILDASPSTVPIEVIDQVFVTGVTARPLTLEEIRAKGLTIDSSSFQVQEFQLALSIEGKAFKIELPVILPSKTIGGRTSKETISLLRALNQQIVDSIQLPPELTRPGLNFSIAPIPFFPVEDGDDDAKVFGPPPIAGLVVIPGNVAFLNQFFSAIVMVSNVAPDGSGLVLRKVSGEIHLPAGDDGVPGTAAAPGDDPLRLGREADAAPSAVVAVVRRGADQELKTPDDVDEIDPGTMGEGEFLIEGLKEGAYDFEIDLKAELGGLPSGPVALQGISLGAVLVRNPTIDLTLSHPRTIRAQEPYDLFATVVNTSGQPANLVSVNLDPRALSGVELLSEATVQFESIAPGEAQTARFSMRSLETGNVRFSLINPGKGLTAGFRLRGGVDERGVPLAPNVIVLPKTVDVLPASLVAAAQRVLGQALSVANTPGDGLPAGVLGLSRATVEARGVELAEAGQRVRLGEPLARVVADLLLDWLGNRYQDEGFDQLLRTTEAGAQFMQEIGRIVDAAVRQDGLLDAQRALAQATVHRDPYLLVAAGSGTGPGPVRLALSARTRDYVGVNLAGLVRQLPYGDVVPLQSSGGRADLLALGRPEAPVYEVVAVGTDSGTFDLGIVVPNGSGKAVQLRYSGVAIQVGGVARVVLDLSNLSGILQVDREGDGVIDTSVTPVAASIVEAPPEAVLIRQLPELDGSFGVGNVADDAVHGLVVAVLFNKPVTRESADDLDSYAVEANAVADVRLQPSGRLAYLLLDRGVGRFVDRQLTLQGIEDTRGNAIGAQTRPVETVLSDGGRVFGRVRRGDGSPVSGASLLLSVCCLIFDGVASPRFVSAIETEADGSFAFDYVTRQGDHFTLSVQDPETGDEASRSARVTGSGQVVRVDIGFIAKGRVRGRVLAADGLTPVPAAQVVLNPSPQFDASSDQRRPLGATSDALGHFAFDDVPVGAFGIEAADARGFYGAASGVLADSSSEAVVTVVLSVSPDRIGRLTGRVFLSDGATPAVDFPVYVGRGGNDALDNPRFDVAGQAVTDETGSFAIERLQESGTVSYSVVALDPATGQSGHGSVAIQPGRTSSVVLVMEPTGRVRGIVYNAQGAPVAGALVAGGTTLGETDASGRFEIAGVPAGPATIEAGDPVTRRRGSASVTVVAGQVVDVVVRLEARATIAGRVLDASGHPVPRATVTLPKPGSGFYFVFANDSGAFRFPDLPLDDWLIQAPGPSRGELIAFMKSRGIDPRLAFTSGDVPPDLGPPLIDPNAPESVLSAYQDALRTYLRLDDPTIVGFKPAEGAGYGWNRVRLFQDSVTVHVDVRFLPQGTAAGFTQSGAGAAMGALVRVQGIKPGRYFEPAFDEIVRRDSDAQTGAFLFAGLPRFDLATFQATGIRAGDFTVQAASPFSPAVVSFSGQLSPNTPDLTGIVLRFPPIGQTNGTISGTVLLPDGLTPAPAGTRVVISFGDLGATTDANGRFSSSLPIPSASYVVTATDATGLLQGRTVAQVPPGGNVDVRIRLLGRGSVRVLARRGDGSAVAASKVTLQRGAFPPIVLSAQSDASGEALFQAVSEGEFSVVVEEEGTGRSGRAGGEARRDAQVVVQVTLAPAGRVVGTFLGSDGRTPIPSADMRLEVAGTVATVKAFATTDDHGRFVFDSVPLGRFEITGGNLATGLAGRASGELTFDGEEAEVTVLESATGEVQGFVLDGTGRTPVSGATVTLRSTSLPSGLQVSAGMDGGFRFVAVPAGTLDLSAFDAATGSSGSATATLTYQDEIVREDVSLDPVGSVLVRVLDSLGQVVENAEVRLVGPGAGVRLGVVGADGTHTFDRVALGRYSVEAKSLATGDEKNGGVGSLSLDEAGALVEVEVRLRGTGRVTVTVVGSDGATTVPGATVTVLATGSFGQGVPTSFAGTFSGFTDGQGGVTFSGVPVGDFTVRATSSSLSGLATGTVASAGQTAAASLRLGSAGGVRGRVLLPDGSTPALQAVVTLYFTPAGGQAGVLQSTTGLSGAFGFDGVPVGPVRVLVSETISRGVRTVRADLSSNGQLLDLGDLVLDNTSPRVVAIEPGAAANGVREDTAVVAEFSEPMSPETFQLADDPDSTYNVSLRQGETIVPGSLSLSTDGRTMTVRPSSSLASGATYSFAILAAPVGPEDLEGLKLLDPFASTFTVRDTTPVAVQSVSPARDARGVLLDSVVRVTFSEPIAPSFSLNVRDAAGRVVAGAADLVLGGTALVFTPAPRLEANQSYTFRLEGVADRAGNALAGGPLVFQFLTIDTLAPFVNGLAYVGTPSRIGGTSVTLRPDLTGDDVAQVEYLVQDAGLRVSTTAPFTADVALPPSLTSLQVSASATDLSGNRSSAFVFRIPIEPNQPPSVSLRAISLVGTPRPGSTVQFEVTAADDVAIARVLFSSVGGVTSSAARTAPGGSKSLTTTFDLAIPANAQGSFTVQAAAVDSVGQQGASSTLTYQLGEQMAPTARITSPAPGSVARPGPLDVVVEATDDTGVVSVTLACTPALTGCGTKAITPTTVTSQTFTVDVPPSASAPEILKLVATARDGSGNDSVPATVTLSFADSSAPRVVSVERVGGGTIVGAGETFRVRARAQDTVGVASFAFTVQGSGSGPGTLPVSPALADATVEFDVTVASGAVDGSTITIRVRARDDAGNEAPSSR